jgi:GNAT superfamily N-acetyltransferase
MTSERISQDKLTFRPVTIDEWDDLQSLFMEPGPQNGCWCMWWRITRSEFNKCYGEANRLALKEIVESGRVPGILAYLADRPVGWCSVAPREEFPVLDRSPTLKRVDDEPVWSIVCFFVASQYRRQGMTKALIEAAIEYAKENGASIIEAYPIIPENIKDPRPQRFTGMISTFEEIGFREVARRSKIRPIVRYHVRG